MKSIITLATLALFSSAHAGDIRCINQDEAIQAVSTNLEAVRKEIKDVSNYWIPRQKIREYSSRIDFLEGENLYKTAYLVKWTCAAGSDCYVGVQVDCEGQVGTYLFAD